MKRQRFFQFSDGGAPITGEQQVIYVGPFSEIEAAEAGLTGSKRSVRVDWAAKGEVKGVFV